MPKKKRTKEPTEDPILICADLDKEVFFPFIKDVLSAYKTGEVILSLVGPRLRIGTTNAFLRDTLEKYNFAYETFGKYVMGFTHVLHFILSEEEKGIMEGLVRTKKTKEAKRLKEKFEFVRDILIKFPEIREQYLSQTYCKSLFLKEISWEADVKYFNSSPERTRKEPPSAFPIGRIRISLGSPEYPIEELMSTNIDFEVSSYDVENIIRSLEKLKSSLAELREKVLV